MNIVSTRLMTGVGLAGALLIVAYGGTSLVLSRRSYHPAAPEVAPAPAAVEVWAAARAIGRGERIAGTDLRPIMVQGTLPPGVQTRQKAIIGAVAVVDIPASSLITTQNVADDPARAGLAQMVPAGMRAVALRTNEEIAVGNFLRPGDHVDIELVLRAHGPLGAAPDKTPVADQAEARTLLQDVTVLSVGSTLSDHPAGTVPPTRDGRQPAAPHVITLAMAPDQIARLALARDQGSVFLALRNPSDIATVEPRAVHMADLRGPAPPPTGARTEQRRAIELITGARRSIIYSTGPDGKR